MDGYKLNGMIERVKYTREAAVVTRLHGLFHHSAYNNGIHSFNMLAMLRLLYPTASSNLLWAIIEHDMPERLTGDFPAPAKWFGVVDRTRLDNLEFDINTEVFGQDTVQKLTERERGWLKGLDILELYLFCKDELMLGNAGIITMMRRIEKFIERTRSGFPVDIVDFYYRVKADPWDTLPDLGD